MKKFKILDLILSSFVILLFIGFFVSIIYYSQTFDYNQRLVYEQILTHEFGQTFNTYNDYVLYKIENS